MASDSYAPSESQDVQTANGHVSSDSIKASSGLNFETARLDTFASWPFNSPVDASRLAKAGFFYKGNGDEVICFSCGGKISGWQCGDSPFEKHRTGFPHCDFVNGRSDNKHLPNVVPRRSYGKFLKQVNAKMALPNGHMQQDDLLADGVNGVNGMAATVTKEHAGRQSVMNGETTDRLREEMASMKNEVNRRETFEGKWPHSFIDPNELARAGFYYVGPGDRVKCAFCCGCLFAWHPEDQPFAVHVSKFPFCPLVLGKEGGITRTGVELMRAGVPLRGYDVCGIYDHHSVPENSFRRFGPEIEKLGIHLHRGPRYKEQASLAARLRTFDSWPADVPVKPEKLAEAGFYYLGIDDNTKCFYCDGGLHDWKEGDDPWQEHAKWFPHCGFLRLNKTEDFIKEHSQAAANQNGDATSLELKFTKATIVNNAKYSVTGLQRHATFPPGRYETAASVFPNITMKSVANGPRRGSCIERGLNGDIARVGEVPKEDAKSSKEKLNDELLSTNGEGRFLCKICLDREVGVVFLPCGHLLACTQCAAGLQDCPVCRQVIQGTVRTFFS